MNTPDERMRAAVADLEALLEEGRAVEDCVEQCAADHGFPPEALVKRAERILGDLSTVRTRNRERAARQAREDKAENAIDVYLYENPDRNFPDWFEDRVGRPPTKVESDQFGTRYMSHFLRNLKFDL